MLTRERRGRRLSGSSHSCRIKRATAAQKLLWLALAPPIQLELGACPEYRDKQHYLKSGQLVGEQLRYVAECDGR